jgi:hypothetical protein
MFLICRIEMKLFWFFMDKARWLIMQYKISLTNVLWSLKDGLALWLWKEDTTRRAKLLVKVLNLVPFCLIWGIDELRANDKERFINNKILKYIEFGSLGCLRMIHTLKLWVFMWNIGRVFWSCYQNLSHNIVMFCWNFFTF